VDLNCPQQVVTVQIEPPAGASKSQKSVESAAVPALVSWTQAVGTRTASFDVHDQELSPDGYLSLRLSVAVMPSDVATGGRSWTAQNLSASIDARVIGEPAIEKLEREVVEQPLSPTTPPAKAKKTAEKKNATKPEMPVKQ